MRNVSIIIALASVVMTTGAYADDLPGTGKDKGKTVVYRDTWGVPHIYAPTAEAGLFAQGYAMAEDRPEQLIINILAGIGQLSAVAGPGAVDNDLRSHMFDHYGVSKRNFDTIKPVVQTHIRKFRDGINHFYATNSDQVPVFWKGREVDEYMLIAFGRLFLYNWSIDEAYEDLERGGIDKGWDKVSRGSNQFAVSPERSATGNAILAIDPHLSWFDFSRFWECRIHAGDLHGSGVTLPGSPYIGLGHNGDLAWAMTTGGPDTADIYELTLNDDKTKYKYDGGWKELTSKEVTLNVRGVGEQKHTLWFSHHGPIIAVRDGKGYAAAMAYADIVTTSDAWYELNFAKDYTGAIKAMETLSVFPQNVMVADTSGNTYFQRTGRVPVRPAGYDFSVPVDGSTSKSEWKGVHPSSDHLQVLNPSHGWMQNCNVPPDVMMPNSPFKWGEQPNYLFSGPGYTYKRYGDAIHGWTNQRGARAVEMLSRDNSVTVEDAMSIINDIRPYQFERWLEALRLSHEVVGHTLFPNDAAYYLALEDIWEWNGALHQDSSAALKYYYWRAQLEKDLPGEDLDALMNSIDDWNHIIEERPPNPLPDLANAAEAIVVTFNRAVKRIRLHHGSINATFGDHFRVGRGEESWPLSGGSLYESRTLRSVSYTAPKADYTQWGRGGQTSTQIVELSKPIKSWGYIPLGNSDDPKSPHYDDQAEKALSKLQLKSSWWTPEELKDHIESRTVLEYKE